MAAIHQQIAVAERHLATMERSAARRERYLDAIDWRQMTAHDAFLSSMDDDVVNEEVASAHMELEHLHGMEILGFQDRNDQVPFVPEMPEYMGYPVH